MTPPPSEGSGGVGELINQYLPPQLVAGIAYARGLGTQLGPQYEPLLSHDDDDDHRGNGIGGGYGGRTTSNNASSSSSNSTGNRRTGSFSSTQTTSHRNPRRNAFTSFYQPTSIIDTFLHAFYEYYVRKGFAAILLSELCHLVIFGFTIIFSIFLIAFIDWQGLHDHCYDEDSCQSTEALRSDNSGHALIGRNPFHQTTSLWFTMICAYFLFFTVLWCQHARHSYHKISQALLMQSFYEEKLGLRDSDLIEGLGNSISDGQNVKSGGGSGYGMPWYQVLDRLLALHNHGAWTLTVKNCQSIIHHTNKIAKGNGSIRGAFYGTSNGTGYGRGTDDGVSAYDTIIRGNMAAASAQRQGSIPQEEEIIEEIEEEEVLGRELTASDIALRLMRRENFIIALINQMHYNTNDRELERERLYYSSLGKGRRENEHDDQQGVEMGKSVLRGKRPNTGTTTAMPNKNTIIDIHMPWWLRPFTTDKLVFTRFMEWALNYCLLDHCFTVRRMRGRDRERERVIERDRERDRERGNTTNERQGERKRVVVVGGGERVEINEYLLHDIQGLQARFTSLGLLLLLLLPLTMSYRVISFFFQNAQSFHSTRSYLGPRTWTPYALWRFREFNEVPHLFAERMASALTPGLTYLTSFPSLYLSIAANCVLFILGSLIASLLLIGIVSDSALLYLHYGEYNLLWYLGITTAIYAAVRSFCNISPMGLAIEDVGGTSSSSSSSAAMSAPGIGAGFTTNALLLSSGEKVDREELLARMCAHTHYFPPHWQGLADREITRKEVASLLQFKVQVFIFEILGTLFTPLVLIFSLPDCADSILSFLR